MSIKSNASGVCLLGCDRDGGTVRDDPGAEGSECSQMDWKTEDSDRTVE